MIEQVTSILKKYGIRQFEAKEFDIPDTNGMGKHAVIESEAMIPEPAKGEIGNLVPACHKVSFRHPSEKPIEYCDVCNNEIDFKEREGSERVATTIFDQNSPLMQRLRWEPIGHKGCAEIRLNRESEKKENEYLEGRKIEFFRQMNSVARHLPVEAEQKNFSTYKPSKENDRSYNLMLGWRPHHEFGFCLMGPAGSGKTHLMGAIYNTIRDEWEAICASTPQFWDPDKQQICAWSNLTELIRTIRNEEIQGGHDKTLQTVKSCKYLFLDDIATGKVSEYTAEMLYLILEHRKNQKLPTFMTTNVTNTEMTELFHERVTSRIKEMTVVLTFIASDFRNNILKSHIAELEKEISGGE